MGGDLLQDPPGVEVSLALGSEGRGCPFHPIITAMKRAQLHRPPPPPAPQDVLGCHILISQSRKLRYGEIKNR